jgi:hypothetical protein
VLLVYAAVTLAAAELLADLTWAARAWPTTI